MKPQGNDNALYSLKVVTRLAFYLVIRFLFGKTDMHDILEVCPVLKFNPTSQKNMFSAAWPFHRPALLIHKHLSEMFLQLSVHEKCGLENPHLGFSYGDRPSRRFHYSF